MGLRGQTARFPSAAATDSDLGVVRNRAQSTLLASMGPTDTSFTVSSGSSFSANMLLTVEGEIIQICAVAGNTLSVGHSSCPNADGRGFDGTTATAHAAGQWIVANIDAYHHNGVAGEIKAIENAMLGSAKALVSSYGAKGDGVTDDTAAIQAALTASGSAGGGVVYAPRGDYVVSGGLSIPQNVVFRGAGSGTNLIVADTGTLDLFTMNWGSEAHNFKITGPAQGVKADGWTFSGASLAGVSISGIRAIGMPNGIKFAGAGCTLCRVQESEFRDLKPSTGVLMQIDGGDDLVIDHLVTDNNPANPLPARGIYITNSGYVSLRTVSTLRVGTGLLVTGGFSIEVLESHFDNDESYGIAIIPSAGSVVSRLRFTHTWACSAKSVGVFINGAAGLVDDILFEGLYAKLNAGHGMWVEAASNIQVLNSSITNNNTDNVGANGIVVTGDAGSDHLSILNSRIGCLPGLDCHQGFGVYALAGPTDYLQVKNNDLVGNTSGAIFNEATGAHNILQENLGVSTPVYADNAAALAAGLTAGTQYRTATGVLMEVY